MNRIGAWGGLVLVALGSAAACDSHPKCRASGPAACTAPDGGTGGSPYEPAPGGAGGEFAAGGLGGDAGAGGDAGSATTLSIPALPFLVEGFADPGEQFCSPNGIDCRVGPWLMAFRPGADGVLEGALVSSGQWLPVRAPQGGREAAAFRLVRGPGDVYRLSSRKRATLATYAYGTELVPGVCLHNDAEDPVPNVSPTASEFRFVDTDGDQIADELKLSGTIVTEGMVGGDYEGDCGYEGVEVDVTGHVLDKPITVAAGGDALHPTLQLDGGFLVEGSARLLAPGGWFDAEPLVVSGLIYGFKKDIVLLPGAVKSWMLSDVIDLGGRAVSPGQIDLGDVEDWPLVGSGDFESLPSGEPWYDQADTVVGAECSSCGENDGDAALPPISGARSLHVGHGGQARFYLERGSSHTHLKLLAFGALELELGPLNSMSWIPTLTSVPADCSTHADFCAAAPDESLREYSIELPRHGVPGGDSDLLLSVRDRTPVFGATDGTGVWLDELRLE